MKQGDRVKMREWVRPDDKVQGVIIHHFMIFEGTKEVRDTIGDHAIINGYLYPMPALEVVEDADE